MAIVPNEFTPVKHVRIVDDEPSMRELMRIVAEAEGYDVSTNYDFPTASASLQAENDNTDIVVMDKNGVHAEDDNGIVAMAQLLVALGKGTVMLAYSALLDEKTRQKVIATGLPESDVVYLNKPFDLDTVVAALKTLAQRRASTLPSIPTHQQTQSHSS